MEGIVFPNDENYPRKLKDLRNPPHKLYYSGKLIWNDPCLAIIGSRDCSSESKGVIEEIIKSLDEKIIIVSGLARGIDTLAHSCSLALGRKNIAVLPGGIKRIYPKENKSLAEKISRTGVLVSEYEDNASPTKFSFVERDRIVSGLSSAVLVVEAEIKSGTMHTARWAKQQEKNIYAIPRTPGCDYLISKGAVPFSSNLPLIFKNDIKET